MQRYVSIVGPGDGATSANCEAARAAGRRLAERGVVVVAGGLGGVMAAAADGARGVGGLSIGLLPGSDRTVGSEPFTVLLPTGLGELRNGLVVRCADVVLAIGGSWGTWSEVALAVRTGVPVIAYDGWDAPAPGVLAAATIDEALDLVWSQLERAGPDGQIVSIREATSSPSE